MHTIKYRSEKQTELHHDLKNTPAPNTDNKGKLLVTVFASASACMTNTYRPKPGYAHLPARKPLYRDSKVASTKFVPRYCTSAFEPISAP
jgi:hypothetical protein